MLVEKIIKESVLLSLPLFSHTYVALRAIITNQEED
jgi:hypothetical protein